MLVFSNIAVMFNMIEEGAPWPRSAPHARSCFLQKDGTEVGQVTSYRILTIASPLYRCYAAMRLADMDSWVQSWALPEMFAGVSGRGAVDAWYEVLTRIESLKLDG